MEIWSIRPGTRVALHRQSSPFIHRQEVRMPKFGPLVKQNIYPAIHVRNRDDCEQDLRIWDEEGISFHIRECLSLLHLRSFDTLNYK